MPTIRTFTHLLPDGKAWRLTISKALRSFFEGLVGGFTDVRTYSDDVYLDLFPETTRELDAWEKQFGILPAVLEADRRSNLAAEWRATGGQDPTYIQEVLQAAGFDVWIHEWWSSGPAPYVPRDPRDYTEQPLIGTIQCSALANQHQCRAVPFAPECNRFLANEPNYLVNENWTGEAPPPIPEDPAYWPYFLYIGGETFGDVALIPTARRAEFERLILKLCPLQHWIVILVDYVTDGVFDSSFDDSFE